MPRLSNPSLGRSRQVTVRFTAREYEMLARVVRRDGARSIVDYIRGAVEVRIKQKPWEKA